MTKKIRLYIQLLFLLLMTVLAVILVNSTGLIPLANGAEPSQPVQLAHSIESGQSIAQQSPILHTLQLLEPFSPPGDVVSESLRSYYNGSLQQVQQLPLETQEQAISAEDNELQQLLKQQWNLAIEAHRVIGARISARLLNDDLGGAIAEVLRGAIQLTLAEADLVTTASDKLAAYKTCSDIAARLERDNQALERAGVGTRLSVLGATYWRQHCEIQAMLEQSQE